jgi:hypothetical protein
MQPLSAQNDVGHIRETVSQLKAAPRRWDAIASWIVVRATQSNLRAASELLAGRQSVLLFLAGEDHALAALLNAVVHDAHVFSFGRHKSRLLAARLVDQRNRSLWTDGPNYVGGIVECWSYVSAKWQEDGDVAGEEPRSVVVPHFDVSRRQNVRSVPH